MRKLPGLFALGCFIAAPAFAWDHWGGDRGGTRFSLTMDRYRQFGDAVWPTRMVAVSDGGTVEVALREVDVNPELSDAAFTPPRRAERLP